MHPFLSIFSLFVEQGSLVSAAYIKDTPLPKKELIHCQVEAIDSFPKNFKLQSRNTSQRYWNQKQFYAFISSRYSWRSRDIPFIHSVILTAHSLHAWYYDRHWMHSTENNESVSTGMREQNPCVYKRQSLWLWNLEIPDYRVCPYLL